MPNEIPLIVALVIIVPLGLLALLITALVTASQARRDVRQLREYVDTLQRETNGQFERLRRQLREQPSTEKPAVVNIPAHDTPAASVPPAITPPASPPPARPPIQPQTPPVAPPPAPAAGMPPAKSVVPPISVSKPVHTPALRPPMLSPPAQSADSKVPGAKPARTLEERLGAQLPIWIGAIALGIGGIWLAKYVIEHAHFSDAARVVAGGAFGVALLLAGAWGHQRNRHIAAAVAAAAVADLYGWVFAAASVFHLIPVWLGFAMMIVITTLAVGLSLRQGPIVAIVGMVGAFLTPALLHTAGHNPAVFAYLLLLQIGLLVVTRQKGWWPLAALTLAGSLIWAGGWVIGMMLGELPLMHGKWVAMFMLGSAASMVLDADSDKRDPWSGTLPGAQVGRIMAWVALIASLAILAMVVRVTHFAGLEWAMMGVLAAGCMALGRLRKQYETLAWLAEATVLALVTMWAVQVDHTSTDHWPAMRWATLGFGTLFTLGAYACAWGSGKAPRWFGMSAGSAVAWFVLAYYAPFPLPLPWQHWWMAALAVAGVLMILSAAVQVRRAKIIGGDESLAWMLIGVSVMLAIAAALGLSGQNISLAWALEVPVIAIIGCRLRVPRLRWMAMAAAAGVLVRLVLNWQVLNYPISENLIFNWLSYGYGVPIIAFALAAWIYARHREDDPPLRLVLEGGAMLLGFMLVTLQIRHGFHASFREADVHWLELSTYINAWMVCALALLVAASRRARKSIVTGGLVIGCVALGGLAIVLLSRFNPLIGDVYVGQTVVFNWLLYGFGLPIIGCAAGAWLIRKQLPHASAQLVGIALTLGFILISMQVRHGFHPLAMKLHQISLVELATYCIAWFSLAGVLLAAGRRWARPMLANAALLIGVIGIIAVIAGLIGVKNPWWSPESVGMMRLFNWLLFAYGLPMVLAGGFAWLIRRHNQAISALAGVVSLVLLWLMVSLEVRQWFVGEFLNVDAISTAEQYAYSAVWVLLGLGLLAAGIVVRGKLVRFASLAVMLLAVCKVFIFDTRHLGDLYRVFSFLGLGVSLLLLAFLYQRFVFRRPRSVAAAKSDDDKLADTPP